MGVKERKESKRITAANFIIRIHGNEKPAWVGEIEFLPSGETVTFEGLLEMILLLQNRMDLHGSPPVTHVLRSWSKKRIIALKKQTSE